MDDFISKPTKLEERARVFNQCDPEAIKSLLSAVGWEALAGILETMISDAPRALNGLQQSLVNDDAVQVRLWAHMLKSNAMTVGAVALGQQFQEVESRAAHGKITAADPQATEARAGLSPADGTRQEIG